MSIPVNIAIALIKTSLSKNVFKRQQCRAYQMNILLVHNFYQQAGGEDQTFADEARLLEQHGHHVGRFTMDNHAIDAMGKLEVARKTVWNPESSAALRKAIREFKAEVVHFHNTFPLISPAAYYAVHEEGAAVVQTLHNYRLLCVAATFCRDDHVCEDCLGRSFAWPGIVHKCYRQNRAASAVVAAMQTFHRFKGTWQREVDVFITLSEFGRRKFIEGGLPAERMMIKPIFTDPDPGIGRGDGDFAIFVGRLTAEKGLDVLLSAWPRIYAETGIKLRIIGGGSMKEAAQAAATSDSGMTFLGRLESQQDVYDMVGQARAFIFPSIWYEGQPRTIVESLAKGTPLLASRLGAMPEMITDGLTGYLFEAGNIEDMAAKARLLFKPDQNQKQLREQCRKEFEARYRPDSNYGVLMNCYETAIRRFASKKW